MPISKKRNAERMRKARAAAKTRGARLLPKSMVRELARLGVRPERWLRGRPVSLDDYRGLQRRLEAKEKRVEWQSGGIAMLHQEIARLRALLATQPAMQDSAVMARVAKIEAEQALHEAGHLIEEPAS